MLWKKILGCGGVANITFNATLNYTQCYISNFSNPSQMIWVACNCNDFINKTGIGAEVFPTWNNEIENCIISGFQYGVVADDYSGNINIHDNYIYNNTYGMYITDHSVRNIINRNNVYNNKYGIFHAGDHSYFYDNIIKNNLNYGIYEMGAINNTKWNNLLLNNNVNAYESNDTIKGRWNVTSWVVTQEQLSYPYKIINHYCIAKNASATVTNCTCIGDSSGCTCILYPQTKTITSCRNSVGSLMYDIYPETLYKNLGQNWSDFNINLGYPFYYYIPGPGNGIDYKPIGSQTACTNGTTTACGLDNGECKNGTRTCINGLWGSCIGAVGPSAEICDGKDNNCDGSTDENSTCPPTTATVIYTGGTQQLLLLDSQPSPKEQRAIECLSQGKPWGLGILNETYNYSHQYISPEHDEIIYEGFLRWYWNGDCSNNPPAWWNMTIYQIFSMAPTCYNQPDPEACNGNKGTCISQNNCSCVNGWTGSNCSNPLPPDYDHDGDVDQSDFGHFQVCIGPLYAGCEDCDFNNDNYINLSDFSVFQKCANSSGPQIPYNPTCVTDPPKGYSASTWDMFPECINGQRQECRATDQKYTPSKICVNEKWSICRDDRADVNQDGIISTLDYDYIREHMGEKPCNEQNSWCNRADTTKDGVVNTSDFIYVRARIAK